MEGGHCSLVSLLIPTPPVCPVHHKITNHTQTEESEPSCVLHFSQRKVESRIELRADGAMSELSCSIWQTVNFRFGKDSIVLHE